MSLFHDRYLSCTVNSLSDLLNARMPETRGTNHDLDQGGLNHALLKQKISYTFHAIPAKKVLLT
jgi:hypothetical protein